MDQARLVSYVQGTILMVRFPLTFSVTHFPLPQHVLASSFDSLCCPIRRPAYYIRFTEVQEQLKCEREPSFSFTVVLQMLHKGTHNFLKDTLTHRPAIFHQCCRDWELRKFFGALCWGFFSSNDLTMKIHITWDLPNIASTDEKRYIYLPLYFSKTSTDTKSRGYWEWCPSCISLSIVQLHTWSWIYWLDLNYRTQESRKRFLHWNGERDWI